MALTRVKKVPTANLVQGSSFLTSTSSLAAAAFPSGSIIQTQHVKTNTKTTTTSGSMGDATNLTLSFTPFARSNLVNVISSPTLSTLIR